MGADEQTETQQVISREDFGLAVSAVGGAVAAATLLKVSTDSVDRWAKQGIPPKRQGLVQQAMRAYLPGRSPLVMYSDLELVAEINTLLGEITSRLGLLREQRPDSDMANSGHHDHGSVSRDPDLAVDSQTFERPRGRSVADTRRRTVDEDAKGKRASDQGTTEHDEI